DQWPIARGGRTITIVSSDRSRGVLEPPRRVPEHTETTRPNSFAIGTDSPPLKVADESSSALRVLEDKLARCLATLTMHFQPIVHAATRARFGYEALLRATDKSLPHPGAILDAAERLEK